MAKSLGAKSVDMKSLIPTMDKVISVNSEANVEKENLEKKLKQIMRFSGYGVFWMKLIRL